MTTKRNDSEKQYLKGCRIERLRDEADALRVEWLRENGWELTSDTPGCFWMWRKGEFFCDAGTAERIQRFKYSDDYFREHPERQGD
jgi:hypothetical protein